MAKTKNTKVPHVVEGVYAKVTCPVTGKETMIKIGQYDFSHSDSPCDLCGSHGHIGFDYVCPECGQNHEYEIRSW
jgi:hypothetical protein